MATDKVNGILYIKHAITKGKHKGQGVAEVAGKNMDIFDIRSRQGKGAGRDSSSHTNGRLVNS